VWIFCTPKQKWDKEIIKEKELVKDMAQMFWDAIWVGGRSKLIIMEWDEGSARYGYSSLSYQTTLEEGLLPDWNEDIDLFMQDNAPIHKSGSTRDWLDANNIETLLIWPPYSLYLNPIRHLWWKLKKTIIEIHPDLRDDGWDENSQERFCDAAIEAWDAIPQDWIDTIILSMPQRLEAVRKARGWHTKY
jgi:transposase